MGIVLLVALVGLSVSTVSAEADATWVYSSGFQVQNMDTGAAASIEVHFFDASGVEPTGSTITTSIPAGGSTTFFPLTTVASGFNGSVVISSSAPLASVVNVIGTSGSTTANASYIGVSGGSTTVTLPLLMFNNGGYNTWFTVQNVGTACTKAHIVYSDGTTADSTEIAPSASYTFKQATEAGHAKVFSGTVTSTTTATCTTAQPLAASVIEEGTSIIFAYNGFTAGSTNPVMPLINANNGGTVTGTQIMNTGASDTSVTLSYTAASAGANCTETQTIAAGKSATFSLGAFATGANSTCAAGARFIGSAQVTTNNASMPLVAIVNQLNSRSGNGEAYSAFDPSTATSTVVMPLIMDRNSGWYTGFSVMNVGSADTVNCTFSNNAKGGAASTYTISQSVAANGALVDIQNSKIMNNYVGSGTCTASGGGKLVGIVNELKSGTGANLLVYEAIGK